VSVNHGEANNAEGLAAIMNLSVKSSGDVLDMAVAALMNFTGLRAEHAHAILSKDVSFVPPSNGGKGSPRSICFKLEYDKNLRAGSTTRVEQVALEKFVPCICIDSLKGNDRSKFVKALAKDFMDEPCLSVQCPYYHLHQYLKLLPDRFGKLNELERARDPTVRPLKLFRARATLNDRNGNRRFLTTPLGKTFFANA